MTRLRPLRPSAQSTIVAVLALAAGATSARAQAPDSAFASLQARGADPRAMGVDQYTSVHRFDALPDGGRIELRRRADDRAGVARIRTHLREIAAAFARGDFRTPAFVHMRPVPGAAVMAARRAAITYAVRDLPRGGEVRITTRDPEALAAVHAFVAFQRQDHRAGGAGAPRHTSAGHGHAHRHSPR
jgi:plasmid stabilization system protein ParE